MAKPSEQSTPEFYRNYIRLLPEDTIESILISSEQDTLETLMTLNDAQAEKAYAEGKWSIKELIQHIIDAENVFNSRALWIARKSQVDLPGFDHNQWVAESNANSFKLSKLLQDYTTMRAHSIATFSKFSDEQLQQIGTANGHEMSCNLFGYLISGHNLHHLEVIKERYL